MNRFLTAPQSMGMTERIAYGIIFWLMMRLAARGYIDPDMAEYIALGVVSGGGAALAWWKNRPQKILEAAANVPNPDSPSGRTVVVASSEMAAATPNSPTVVSSDEHLVVLR